MRNTVTRTNLFIDRKKENTDALSSRNKHLLNNRTRHMFNRPSYLLTVSVVPALIYQEFCPPLSPSPSPPPPDIKVWLTSGRLAGCMVGDQSRPQQLAAQTQTIHHRMVGNTQRRHESYLPSTAAISLYLPLLLLLSHPDLTFLSLPTPPYLPYPLLALLDNVWTCGDDDCVLRTIG